MYAEGGVYGMYAATSPAAARQVVDLMRAEAARLVDSPVSEAELARAVGQIRGSFVLALEDSGSRMTRLGAAEIVTGRLLSFDETLRNYGSVTVEDVQSVARDVMSGETTLVLVGPTAAGAALLS